jgi:hypothetical protein
VNMKLAAASKPAFILTFAALAFGCGAGQGTEKHGARIGGCELDTIRLGLAMERTRPEGVLPYRISIRSVRDAGSETYKAAASDLTSLLDSAGVAIYRRSDLVHITKGACWPPYFIDFEVGFKNRAEAESLFPELAGHPIAGLLPSSERPAGYGKFFITASSGSSDLWTAWYGSAK